MVVFSSLVQKNRSLPDMPLRRTINSTPDTLWIASLYYSDWNHTIHGYEILLESSESALQNNKKISWKLPIWLKLTNVSGLTATWIHDVSCPKPHTPNMLQRWTHGQRSSMHLTWAWIWGPEEPFLSLTNHFVWFISSFSLPNIIYKNYWKSHVYYNNAWFFPNRRLWSDTRKLLHPDHTRHNCSHKLLLLPALTKFSDREIGHGSAYKMEHKYPCFKASVSCFF